MPWQNAMRVSALDGLRHHYVSAEPELNFENPFQLLVAVVLSAQSTDRQVNHTTEQLFTRIATAEHLANLEVDELEEMIKGVGLYRNKAKNLIQLGKLLMERHQGEVPCSFEELEALPGVGHKTASVVMAIAFDVPALAVDTHVFRVANRTGMAEGQTVLQVEQQLKELIPQDEWAKAHHWLLHHGRYCCKARRPLCADCPIRSDCRYSWEQSE